MKVTKNFIRNITLFFIPFIIGFLTLEIGIRTIQAFILKNNKIQYSQYSKIYSDEREQDYLFWHKPILIGS